MWHGGQLEFHNSEGDATAVVLVDSRASYWNYVVAMETIPVMLAHYGIPFRLVDRGGSPVPAGVFDASAVVVIAQAGMGAALTEPEIDALLSAAAAGVGIANLDGELRSYPRAYLEFLGVEEIDPHPGYFRRVRVTRADHPVTAFQETGELHESQRHVSGTIVSRWRETTVALAETYLDKEALITIRHFTPHSTYVPGTYPAVLVRSDREGRAVQFTLNPRIWRTGFIGPTQGIDDLLFQSILYAARKPFFCYPIPPFLLLSVDDCDGAHDFEYARTATQIGFEPLVSLFLDRVPERLHDVVRELSSRRVLFNSHAFGYYDLLTFQFGLGEYDEKQIAEAFGREQRFWDRLGVDQARTVRMHWGEYGVEALPYLKRTGRRFFNPALQPGLIKADQDLRDGYRPYNLQTHYYDRLREDDDFLCFGAMPERGGEDFLIGSTAYAGESEGTDVSGAVRRASDILTRAYRGGFFGELVTHEQKIRTASLDEWKRILSGAEKAVSKYRPVFVGHDRLGDYLVAREGVRVTEGRVDDRRLSVVVEGVTGEGVSGTVVRDEEKEGFSCERVELPAGERVPLEFS